MSRSLALPSIMRQRRSARTCGRCDRSTPARLSSGENANDRFTPQMAKYESETGDWTAITKQFAQSTPSFEGPIWSWRGNRCSPAISVQCRSTRSTSRRLNTTFTVSETMVDISSVCGNIATSVISLLCRAPSAISWTSFRGIGIAHCNSATDWPYLPLTLIWPVEPAHEWLAGLLRAEPV